MIITRYYKHLKKPMETWSGYFHSRDDDDDDDDDRNYEESEIQPRTNRNYEELEIQPDTESHTSLANLR
nr:MAG: hypothetical protein [Marsupenaeus japonicus endogenous nimavirus]